MHEWAGGCIARAARAAALTGALAILAAGSGWGGFGSVTNAGATPGPSAVPAPARVLAGAAAAKPPTPAERKMAAIIEAWSVRLNRNDNAGVAELYSLPTTIIQDSLEYRLKTRSEVALWFSELPCSGTILSISYEGKFATAVFRLGNRGSTPCDAPGAIAAARFEIVKGKIVLWTQVAVPKRAKTTLPVA